MLSNLTAILRMIKFSHTVFAMPFAMMSTFLAANGGQGGFCGWSKIILIVICMVTARSVAMTFNRIVDADIDAQNPRTAGREIPSGIILPGQAKLFLWGCAVLFVTATLLFWKPLGGWFGYGNPWPVMLSLPVLLFICLYSYAKRFTWACHFWLGASLMLSPVAAWIAVCPPQGPVLAMPALILGSAVLLWTTGFDIIYACQDTRVDRHDGLYSLPASLGIAQALWVSRCCHSVTFTLLLFLGLQTELGGLYLAAVSIVAVLLVWEHLLVRRGQMQRITMAFATLNGIISTLLAGAAICDIMI